MFGHGFGDWGGIGTGWGLVASYFMGCGVGGVVGGVWSALCWLVLWVVDS